MQENFVHYKSSSQLGEIFNINSIGIEPNLTFLTVPYYLIVSGDSLFPTSLKWD